MKKFFVVLGMLLVGACAFAKDYTNVTIEDRSGVNPEMVSNTLTKYFGAGWKLSDKVYITRNGYTTSVILIFERD